MMDIGGCSRTDQMVPKALLGKEKLYKENATVI
jgi:hypothetical protein